MNKTQRAQNLRRAHRDGARVVAAGGPTEGREVVYAPRFASDPYPWGHGPDLNDGLRFDVSEVRLEDEAEGGDR